MANTSVITSSYGLLRWPHLATPRPSDTAGVEPKYVATFVFGGPNGLRPGDDQFLQTLLAAMNAASIAQWNVDMGTMQQRLMAQNKLLNLALKKNADPARAKHAGIGSAPAGFHFEAKTKFVPDCFNQDGTKVQADPAMFYDGAVVRGYFTAYASEHPKSGPYIGINLHGVQFVQHGPRLGGVEIKPEAVNAAALPSDLPQAPGPNPAAMGQPPAYGQPGQPLAASPEASWGAQPQGQPPSGQWGAPTQGQPPSGQWGAPTQGQPQGQPPAGGNPFGF